MLNLTGMKVEDIDLNGCLYANLFVSGRKVTKLVMTDYFILMHLAHRLVERTWNNW